MSTEHSSEANEKSVVVVGHRVTKDGVEYLLKDTQESDSAGIWIPRENVDLTLLAAYTRRQRTSRCSTWSTEHFKLLLLVNVSTTNTQLN